MQEKKIFDYTQEEMDALSQQEPLLGQYIAHKGKIEREVIDDLFTALVNSIIGQQISTKAFETIWGRFVERIGEITPESVLQLGQEVCGEMGIGPRKYGYLCGIARDVQSGKLQLDTLRECTNAELIEKLIECKGIGVWTAEMILIFCFQRRDVVSTLDLGIAKGIARLYGTEVASSEEITRFANKVSPYGTIASFYLWELAKEPVSR